jgi:hypothetical protein
MKNFLFLISLSLILLSCKKGAGNFTLKGEIDDLTFNTPLTNTWLKLYKVSIGTSSQIIQDSMLLAADGKYEFTFPREQVERYIIEIQKDGYFPIIEDVYFTSLTLEQDNIRNYSTHAKAWIGLKFVNENPSPLDLFTYTKQLGLEDCTECCPSTEQEFQGELDTTIYCINNGNEPYSILYSVYGTSNTGILSEITPPFDTTYINVTY